MSRLGKRVIAVPDKTTVAVDGDLVKVTGPKGELMKELHKDVKVQVTDEGVDVKPATDTPLARALWGTYASHIINMIKGVNEEFKKALVLEGVGYRVALEGNTLVLNVGYSHSVNMPIPEGLTVTVEKNNIAISGINKELVGQFAANVRAKKKPEPYKGKGLRYSDEIIRRKQGKKAA